MSKAPRRKKITRVRPHSGVSQAAEQIAAHLNALLADSEADPQALLKALGDLLHEKDMSAIAKTMGVRRYTLNQSLSGNMSPSFKTILEVFQALGLRLRIERPINR